MNVREDDLGRAVGSDSCASDELPRETGWASLRSRISEVLSYGIVSAVGLLADAGLLQMLVKVAGWHYLVASTMSFIVGAVLVYLLSTRFVFRVRRVKHRTLEFCYFLAVGLVGLLVNAVTLWMAITLAGAALMPAKAFAATCTFSTNYLLRRRLLFSP